MNTCPRCKEWLIKEFESPIMRTIIYCCPKCGGQWGLKVPVKEDSWGQ